MYTIYKITCLENGKIYVGATCQTAKRRFKGHWDTSRNPDYQHLPMYQDMSALGKDAFTVEAIESGLSQEEAALREEYWIDKFSDDGYSLYNQAAGGGGISLTENQEKEIIRLYKEGLNTWKIAELVGRSQRAIADVLNRNKIYIRGRSLPPRPVLCVETGAIYPSAGEAARQLGLNISNIFACCQFRQKSAGGMHLCFLEDKDTFIIQEPKTENTPKKVICVETKVIYPSISEAARQLGLNLSSISQCCTGQRQTTGGYHFEFV